MLVSELIFLKAVSDIFTRPLGINNFPRFVPINASSSITTKLFGKSTFSKLLHSEKAPADMVSTPSGIVTALIFVYLNAFSSIYLTLLGNSINSRLTSFEKALRLIRSILSLNLIAVSSGSKEKDPIPNDPTVPINDSKSSSSEKA